MRRKLLNNKIEIKKNKTINKREAEKILKAENEKQIKAQSLDSSDISR